MAMTDERFARTALLLGEEASAQIRAASIAVCGLGGVGSAAAEALARAGVGSLTLIDFDTVSIGNINRQLLALNSTVSREKAALAAARIDDINPACRVSARRTFLDTATIPPLLAEGHDVVIDAIDSVSCKVALLAAAAQAGTQLISCMGAGARTNPLAVRTGDISESFNDPLARIIRKRLRRRGISRGIRCIYSVEEPRRPRRIPEPEIGGVDRGRRRIPVGSVSWLPPVFGMVAAHEALRIVAGSHGHVF